MPFMILACGNIKVIAPAIGPAIPAKSDKSPVLKPKSFSSIIVFKRIVEPSLRVLVWIGNPSSSNPAGVKATCPLVFLVKPEDPTKFSKTASCSFMPIIPEVSALANCALRFFKSPSRSVPLSICLSNLPLTPVS